MGPRPCKYDIGYFLSVSSHYLTQLFCLNTNNQYNPGLYSVCTHCTVSSYSDLSHRKSLAVWSPSPTSHFLATFTTMEQERYFRKNAFMSLAILTPFLILNLFHDFFNPHFNWCTKNKKICSFKNSQVSVAWWVSIIRFPISGSRNFEVFSAGQKQNKSATEACKKYQ